MEDMNDPWMRIGDADRTAAVARLRQHQDAGRLTAVEFQERENRALAAGTQADLDLIFADLPSTQANQTFDLYPHQAVVASAASDPRPIRVPPQPAVRVGHPISGRGWAIIAVCFLAGLFLIVAGNGYIPVWAMSLPLWIIPVIVASSTSRSRQRSRRRDQDR